jgi:coenzyme F420 hydrogenase subunit beta
VVCPASAITMKAGTRFNSARTDTTRCTECGLCLTVWPSAPLTETGRPEEVPNRCSAEGNAWLACSTDAAIRRSGASGGFITALVIHLLKAGDIDGAVVTRADERDALGNASFLARTEGDLLKSQGSRYGPASACMGLTEVLHAPGRYAFVGKPCEVQALRGLQERMPLLRQRVVLAVGLFCGQTPAREATAALLARLGLEVGACHRVEYRGDGWPGTFRAFRGTELKVRIPYRQAWDYLAEQSPALCCLLCDDKFAECADISVGDPWGLVDEKRETEGLSFVLTRTERGRQALAEAGGRGAIEARPVPAQKAEERCRPAGGRAERRQAMLALYRVLFLGRVGQLGHAVRGGLPGLRTLWQARRIRSYYGEPVE